MAEVLLGFLIGIVWMMTFVVLTALVTTLMDEFFDISLAWPPRWWLRWRYPYVVNSPTVDLAMDLEVDRWLAENRVAARQDGLRWRFRDEKDAAIFKLRWL